MQESLTNKEFEIMELIWKSNDGITYKELCSTILADNDLTSVKTISTHLFRLTEKGFVRAEGIRRKRVYFAKISRSEYDEFLSRRIVDQLFEGSIKKFVSAFTLTKGLTEQEVLALKALLEQEGE